MFELIYFTLLMLWVMFEDVRSKIIPDAISVGLVSYAFVSSLFGDGIPLHEACLGLLVGGGLMLALSIVSVMGGGDVKLMGALGMWFGLRVLDTFFLSFLVGAVVGIFYYFKYRDRKQEIPFGPSIAVAALLQIFFDISLLGDLWQTILP